MIISNVNKWLSGCILVGVDVIVQTRDREIRGCYLARHLASYWYEILGVYKEIHVYRFSKRVYYVSQYFNRFK